MAPTRRRDLGVGPCICRATGAGPKQRATRFRTKAMGTRGPYLRTGDLGVVKRRFFVVMNEGPNIIHGRNHHPQDMNGPSERTMLLLWLRRRFRLRHSAANVWLSSRTEALCAARG